MLRNKRSISLFLSLVLVLGIVLGFPPKQSFADNSSTLQILHTNDIHGRFEYKDDREPSIGFSRLKTKVDELRAKNPNTLLLDAGDTTHGTVDITLSNGEAMIDLMNVLGYDAMAPGNHDFNYGYKQLLKLKGQAKFPVLAANVIREKDGKSDFEAYTIKELNGMKVGIFGLATEETKYKSNPKNTEGIAITDYIKASKDAVAALKKEKVDIIVALSHIGIDQESEVTTKDIAAKVEGIDLIVDGHSHTALPEGIVVGKTLIVQTGAHLSNLGVVEIDFKDGKVSSKKASLFSAADSKDLVADEAVSKKLEAMKEKNEVIKQEIIGKTNIDLVGERDIVRTKESTLGNVITDAMLKASGADVALTNGGGIRASIPKGEVTLGGVMNAFPFTNFLSVIEVTGQDILDALEHGVDSYPGTAGKFPHVAGMKYVFNPDKAAGERVVDVKIGGKDLDKAAKYELVTNDFVAIGGDDYDAFKGKKIIAEGALLSDVLVEYFKSEGEINPSIEGRIVPGKKAMKETDVERLAGERRVQTAIKTSQEAYKDGAGTVVLAGYNGEVDALAGTLLASSKNAPALLTVKDKLTDDVKAEIKRLGAKNVYVLGGKNVLAPAVETQLKGLGLTVKRLGGKDRFDTAAMIAKEVKGKSDKIFLASGESERLADALAIAPVSAMKNAPVLLVQNNKKLPKVTMDAIKAMGVKEIEFVGGEKAISDSIKGDFKEIKFDRVSGDNREKTALAIANKYFKGTDKAIVVYGWKYADALVGGYLGKMINAPILLTGTDNISNETLAYLGDNTDSAYVLGGKKVVSTYVLNKIVNAVGPMVPGEDEMTLTILGTTDIHGNIYNWSYENEKETNNSGMTKVHSVIKEVRAENPNTILVDAGDLIQGTILTDEVYTKDLSKVNPMADVFNYIEYDAMTLGNHEFNFGLDVVNKFKKDAKFPVLSANIFNKADESNFAEPYTIVERNGLKVGILGLTTPNIPRWDGSKVTSLSFKGMDEAADMYIDEMYEKGADIIVTVSHAGLGQEYQAGDDMRTVLEKHPDISAAVVGHTHASVKETVGTTIVGGARSNGREVIRIDIDLKKKDGKWETLGKSVDLIQVEKYEVSKELEDYAKDYHQATLEFIKGEFGTASEDFQPKNEIKGIPEGYIKDTAVMDLINQIQLDDSGADVSAAALFSDDSDIKKGPITYADIFGIYRFPNTLVMVEATGQELINYMEWSVKYFNTYKDGDLSISFNPKVRSYLYDMFAGVDYKIDLSKPAGERITDVMFKGKPLKMDETLKLVVNDYRYSVLKNDKILSGEPIYLSDPVSSRELIAKHIKELGTISPKVDNNWEITGIDLNHPLRDYIIGEVNAGRIELPKSEDGRTSNVKALNVYELIKDGTIPESVLKDKGLDSQGKPL